MKPTLVSLICAALAAIDVIAADPASQQSKASSIVVPKITFNKAPIQLAVRYLTLKSKELDPEKTGVVIVLAGPEDKQTRVSLDMVNISVADAVKKLAEAANLDLRIEAERIVLTTKLPAASAPAVPVVPPQQIPGLNPVPR